MGPRIVIVGGGITGAFSAYFLARLGAEVKIVERGELAGQASSRNVGAFNPLHGAGIPGPLQALALCSQRLHREQFDDLRRLSGIDFPDRSGPRLHVAVDEGDAAELAERAALYSAEPGFAADWLEPGRLGNVEPRLRAGLAGALRTEGNVRVDCAPYTQAVLGAALALGAEVVRGEASGLSRLGGRAVHVLLHSTRIACDGVVIATGPWCEGPAEWLGVELPVEPVKGELLLVEPEEAPPRLDVTWREFGVYAAGSGRLLLAGTEDRDGFDSAPSSAARERILSTISDLLPGLGSLRVVGHTAGLRPVSRDGLPIVGLAPRWENAFLALGPGRKGMLLSAALGLAAAQTLTGGGTSVPIGSCAPDRDSR